MPIPVVADLKNSTQILNTTNICNSLNRPPLFLKQFFAYEFGASCKLNSKNNMNVLEIQGNIKKTQVIDAIYKFINLYILCKCGNPETIYKIQENKLFVECHACGHSSEMKEDRMTKFILKNFKELSSIYDTNDSKNITKKENNSEETVNSQQKKDVEQLTDSEFVLRFSERVNLSSDSIDRDVKIFKLLELMLVNQENDPTTILKLLIKGKVLKKSFILKHYTSIEIENVDAESESLKERVVEVRREILKYFDM